MGQLAPVRRRGSTSAAPTSRSRSRKLSGGERNRLHLAKLLRSGGNVLLLDEPTNDLDVDTLRALEEALLDFAGCAVVISPRSLVPRPRRDARPRVRGRQPGQLVRGQLRGLRGAPPRAARRRGRPPEADHLQASRALSGELRAPRSSSAPRSSQASLTTASAARQLRRRRRARWRRRARAGRRRARRRCPAACRRSRSCARAGRGRRRRRAARSAASSVALLGVRAEAALAGREVVADARRARASGARPARSCRSPASSARRRARAAPRAARAMPGATCRRDSPDSARESSRRRRA